MKIKALKLVCGKQNRFRLGSFDLEHTTHFIHSDTLFSAIINSVYQLYGTKKASDFVYHFKNRKLVISSAFYLLEFYSDNKLQFSIKFFPRIFGRSKPFELVERSTDRKKLKKIKFFSLEVLKDFLRSVKTSGDEIFFDCDLNSHKVIDSSFLVTEREFERIKQNYLGSFDVRSLKLFNVIEYPKVSVKGEELYFQSDISLVHDVREGTGFKTHFYFFYDSRLNSKEEALFLSALRFLGDEGIGGDRSTGGGQFEGIEDLGEFRWEQSGIYQTNLSLVLPSKDDLCKIYSYDSMVRGGGWIYLGADTGIRQKRVRMIKEGAILKNDIEGRLVEVGNVGSTVVYRNGINFGLNFGGSMG